MQLWFVTETLSTLSGTIIGSGTANPGLICTSTFHPGYWMLLREPMLGKKVEDNGVPATANHSPEDHFAFTQSVKEIEGPLRRMCKF